MSENTEKHYSTSVLHELNILVHHLKSIMNLGNIVSLLTPTKTYSEITLITQHNSSYENILQNIIDRVYLVLNVVLIKLESFSNSHGGNVYRPKRFSMGTLCRIIVNKLGTFHHLQSAPDKNMFLIGKDACVQTEISFANNMPIKLMSSPKQNSDCQSCIILFKQLNNIAYMFKDRQLKNTTEAKVKVKNSLFLLNNEQSMAIMCDGIHEDLRLFLDDYQAINIVNASSQIQYDKLDNEFINYMAQCDARFAQNEDALKTLTNKLDLLQSQFANKLQVLYESSTAISKACCSVERFLAGIIANRKHQDNQEYINALQKDSLELLAKHLKLFETIASTVAQQIFSSIDTCARKITMLQSHLRQLNASNLKAHHVTCVKTQKDVNVQVESDVCIVALAGNSPIEDMLQHIESNKLKIDDLHSENVALQRTIEQIKMRVTY